MPTPVFCCGAECGLIATAHTAAGANSSDSHWDGFDANIAVDATVFAPGGSSMSWKFNPSAAARLLESKFPSLQNVVVVRFKVMYTTAPNAAGLIAWLDNSTSLIGIRYNTANSSFELYDKTSGNNAVGPVVSLNRWYTIEYVVNATTNPWTASWQVDGIPYGSISPARAGLGQDGVCFGNNISATYTCYFDDILVSNTAADYPLGTGVILPMRPNRDGVHSFTAGDFKYNNSTNVATNATDVYTYLDDLLDNTTDFIAQAVIRTTGYVEVGFAPLPQILSNGRRYTINGLEIVADFHASAGQTENFGMRITDQGTEATVFSLNLGSASSTNYRKFYVTSPTTGRPWNPAQLSGMMARFGFSSDASPIPFVDAVVLEVDLKPNLQVISAADLILFNSPRASKSPMVFPMFISPQSTPTKELKSIDGLLV